MTSPTLTNPTASTATPSSEPQLRIELPTRRATIHLAQRVAKHVRIGDLLILVGPLGAGKTFFVRGLARALGLPGSEPVTSPTFALVQELQTKSVPVVHADLYRLTKVEDVDQLGLKQARDENCLVIEWGEPYIAALGGDALVLELTRAPKFAQLRATGTRSRELLDSIRT